MSDFKVNLKWALWSKHKAYWDERAPGVWEKLEACPPGETLEVASAPQKEIRYGTVRISRNDDGTWQAYVHFVTEWDSPEDLTDALDLSPEAIQGVLPFTEYGEPGIEREEHVKAPSFQELMRLIRNEEILLIKADQDEWKELEELYGKT
jgi:hypothetical protein